MENTKYYTPTIEEFHVGFEYEWFDGNIWNKSIQEYVDPGLFDNGDGEHSFEYQLSDIGIKVKYLDREDIESLGWTFKSTNKMRTWYTGSDNWFNNTIPTGDLGRYWNFELSHDPKYNGIIIKAATNYGETDTFFEGTIKNKSELKKLMEQLNIR